MNWYCLDIGLRINHIAPGPQALGNTTAEGQFSLDSTQKQ